MLIPGLYCASRILSAETLESKNGKAYLKIDFALTHRADNEQWISIGAAESRSIRLFVSDKAYSYTEAKLVELGFNGDFLNPQFSTPEEVYQLVCVHEMYEGKSQEKWDLAGSGGSEGKSVTEETIRDLSARWSSAHAQAPIPASAPAMPTPVAAAPVAAAPPTDDDNPF